MRRIGKQHIGAVLLTLALGAVAVPDQSHAAAHTQDTAPTGGGVPFDNTQANLALNFSVATSGFFPAGAGGSGSTLALGAIRIYPFNFLPGGSADTGGGLLPISNNAALFSLMGTTFGGDGETTFALPNLEETIQVGSGSAPGLGAVSTGAVFGFNALTLSVGEMPVHAHAIVGAGSPTGATGNSEPIPTHQNSIGIIYAINTGGNFSAGGDHGFLGEINLFAVGNTFGIPAGWIPAEGQLLPISSNSALFSLLGTTYGGDGVTMFALPDFRGRTAIGAGNRPGAPAVVLGQRLGSETIVLTENELPSHTHGLPPSGDSTGPTGGDGMFSNIQPSLGVNFLIALQGIFPSVGSGSPDGTTPFVGEIVMTASANVPTGYALAQGQLLAISSNTSLFALLGTVYGGDGATTFALPELRGRSAIDESAGRPIGSSGGLSPASADLIVAELPMHVHTVPEPSMVAASVTALLTVVVVARKRKGAASRRVGNGIP